MNRMVRFFLITVSAAALAIIGCDNDESPSTGSAQVNPTSTAVIHAADVSSESEKRSKLTDMLTSVGILQQKGGSDYQSIAYFEDARVIKQKRTFGFNHDHVQVIIQVQRDQLKTFLSLQSAIRVEGNVQYALSEKDEFEGADWTRVYLDVTDIKGPFRITLGNVPPFEMVRLDRSLDYHPVTEMLQYPYLVLPNQMGNHEIIFVSENEDDLAFAFTEPIDQSASSVFISADLSGEWKGDRQYLLHLPQELPYPYIQVGLDNVYAVQGTYLSRDQSPNSVVRKIPDRKWYSYPDGDPIGFSERDRFYDFILPSPDPTQYIGLIDLYYAIYDGEAIKYAFYLERKGEEPYLIAEDNGNQGISGLWIDKNVFLYWDDYRVYTFHTDSLERRILLDQQSETVQIHEVAYDKSEHKLYIVTANTAPGSDTVHLQSWQSENLSPPVKTDFPYNLQVPLDSLWGSFQFRVHDRGFFYTKKEGVQSMTVFIDRQGRRSQTPGELFMVSGNYAILQVPVVEGIPDSGVRYIRWNIKSPAAKPIEIAKAPGNVHAFGAYLISAKRILEGSGKKQYHRYDLTRNEWEPLHLSGNNPYVLYQEKDAIYRY